MLALGEKEHMGIILLRFLEWRVAGPGWGETQGFMYQKQHQFFLGIKWDFPLRIFLSAPGGWKLNPGDGGGGYPLKMFTLKYHWAGGVHQSSSDPVFVNGRDPLLL